ncbi:hypothetical protein [Saccharicrinis sp. FJH54]|uniref:hypothetical protein n=1 Tax=Saccharicrinis sp. FJH54 TaxID=3344665 RepID=UPI0035D51882
MTTDRTVPHDPMGKIPVGGYGTGPQVAKPQHATSLTFASGMRTVATLAYVVAAFILIAAVVAVFSGRAAFADALTIAGWAWDAAVFGLAVHFACHIVGVLAQIAAAVSNSD